MPGEHHFLINPYDLMFEEITASSLVKIDHEGNKIVDRPAYVNRAGFVIHSAIHMATRTPMRSCTCTPRTDRRCQPWPRACCRTPRPR